MNKRKLFFKSFNILLETFRRILLTQKLTNFLSEEKVYYLRRFFASFLLFSVYTGFKGSLENLTIAFSWKDFLCKPYFRTLSPSCFFLFARRIRRTIPNVNRPSPLLASSSNETLRVAITWVCLRLKWFVDDGRLSPRNSWACLLDRGSNVDEFRESGEMSIVFISIYGKVEGAKIDRIFAICRNITKEII